MKNYKFEDDLNMRLFINLLTAIILFSHSLSESFLKGNY